MATLRAGSRGFGVRVPGGAPVLTCSNLSFALRSWPGVERTVSAASVLRRITVHSRYSRTVIAPASRNRPGHPPRRPDLPADWRPRPSATSKPGTPAGKSRSPSDLTTSPDHGPVADPVTRSRYTPDMARTLLVLKYRGDAIFDHDHSGPAPTGASTWNPVSLAAVAWGSPVMCAVGSGPSASRGV